ncbi:MAG TPA: hypothetical protein VFR90_08850 [Methylibium sp.]|uniref:hypothetical protein n=1 Tax=Methylibium sp. TaxID=2067992 RepID=UPI002DBE80DD|nr:hypothetical protein [Methylibium sp.]HEU4459215.1 hypothetical protein [Methylibium sp.]
MSDDFFAPPAFKADEALANLKRHLRDIRLLERAGRMEWKGQPLVELSVDGEAIVAKTVRKPIRTPEWQTRRLVSAAEVRRWLDDFKRQFAAWNADDD